MGMTNPNAGCVSQYRYIPNWKSGLYLCTDHYMPGAYCGTTGATTNTYACSNQPDYVSGGYVDGEMFHVKFINASNSTPLTLNVGGRGAVQIYTQSGAALTSIGANTLATLTYDAVLGGVIYRAGGQSATVPYELLVGLCNRVGCDYWANFPGQIDDESVTTISQVVRDRLSSNLNAYFEYGNEIWNFGGGFPYTSLALAKGTALGFPSDNNRQHFGWYALRHRQIMGLVTAAWSPRSASQLNRVLAFQAFGPKSGTDQYRLQGLDLASVANGGQGNAAFVSITGNANYRTVGNRPIDYTDALSYATYYSGAQFANFDANYLAQKTAVTVIAATSANPTVLQTSADHGLTTGYRVQLGRNTENSKGANFTGDWGALNQVNANVTVIDSTHFSVPVDASAFAAYSSNGGSVELYADEMAGLTTAADNYASGNPTSMAAALDWVDADVRNGTNYGATGTGGSASQNMAQLATLANGTGIYPQWDTLAVTYNKKVCLYEGGFETWYPVAATCTRLGISTAYGGSTGKIATLLTAYKNDRRFYTLVLDQMKQFFSTSKSDVWAWLLLAGGSQWATMTGDMFTATYQNWTAMRLNNNGKRRLFW